MQDGYLRMIDYVCDVLVCRSGTTRDIYKNVLVWQDIIDFVHVLLGDTYVPGIHRG